MIGFLGVRKKSLKTNLSPITLPMSYVDLLVRFSADTSLGVEYCEFYADKTTRRAESEWAVLRLPV